MSEFKAQVVLDVLTDQLSPAEPRRRHTLTPNLLSLWKTTFLQQAHAAYKANDHCSDEQLASTSWSGWSGGSP